MKKLKSPIRNNGTALLLWASTLLCPTLVATAEPSPLWKREYFQPIEGPAPKGMTLFNRKHENPLGGRGKDRFNVSQPAPACGQKGRSFDHARLVLRQQRFAHATLSQPPAPGCQSCPPLIVNWVNEPTGKLDYQLQIYWRETAGKCPAQTR